MSNWWLGEVKSYAKKNDIAFQTQDFNWHSVFPHMIARGDYSFFAPKGGGYSREGDSSREAILSNINLLTGSHVLYILFYYSIIN